MPPSATPLVSRYTYRLHARAALLEGILAGILVTQDVVARKTLEADQFQIMLLTMAPSASMLLALVLARRFADVEQRKVFLWAGVLGRLSLLGMAMVFGPWPFLGILLVGAVVQTVVIPAQNAVYQANYKPEIRGRLFGRAQVYGGVATAAAALGAGVWLDHDPAAYRWLYPIAGAAGFASAMVFGRIRLRRSASLPAAAAGPGAAGSPGPSAAPPPARAPSPLWRLLFEDAPFRRFETAMFVYGLGFMCMMPVFARLFVDELNMDYSDASLAKGVVFSAVPVVALSFAGRMHDRLGLERVATRAYVVLAVFAAGMAVVRTPAQVVAGFALFGLGMAGVNIAWSMGPIKYAPPGEAARYMGVHVALVGIRALIGHPLGASVAAASGSSRPTFAMAAGFFSLATVLMMRAERLAAAAPSGIRPAAGAAR
ncbi:MAG: MFS transporter [Planctomycetes bacterium]|nr:MFS transporter [Planctomycetota bacterium]